MPSWLFLRTNHLLTRKQFKELLMSAAQDVIDQLTAQLDKAKTEILGKIADLEAQVAAGETPDFTALRAAAQALDDVVLDEPPAEEPPTEEPA